MSAQGNNQTIPSIFTNEMFMRAAAGADWERVKVTMFAGDPRKQPRDAWVGYPAVDMLKARAQQTFNTYFSVSVQNTDASRGAAGFEKIFVVVLDDVGTKVSLSQAEGLLGSGPSYMIETSPGNCQAGWFVEAISDRDWAVGLLRALYEALGRRADNLKNLVGYMRLPVGTNGKQELGPGGFAVRLTHWAPGVRIALMDWVEIEQRIGGVVAKSPALGRLGATGMPDPGEIEADGVLTAFRLLGRVQSLGRRMTMGWGFDVECPWSGEHSERAASGASYVPVRQRYHCHHGHCQDRTMGDVRAKLDEMLRMALGTTLAALEFDDVDAPPVGDQSAGGPSGEPDEAARMAETIPGGFEATEDGVALAFAARHEGRLRFDHRRQRWFCWTGGFWREDEMAHAFAWARKLARQVRQRQDAGAGMRALARIAAAAAIERAARTDERLAVNGREWDLDIWRVGAPGCEIDLRTGGIEAPDPAHGITRQLRVAPSAMATPVWDQFLWDSTGGDVAMIGFLQAWMGYCLTGDTSEEKFVFVHGPGGNGKSTFLGVMLDILHDYAMTTPIDTFMLRKHPAHPAEIARLAGARAVAANEIEDGSTFNAVRLKELTGRNGPVAARFMRQDFFEFVPRFKITFVGNHQPRIPHADDAMRRRLILVPFTQTPARVDPTLKDRLIAEYPGILAWAIAGENLRRTMGGLGALIPGSVVAATGAYLDDQDLFRAWAEDRCEFGRGPGFDMTLNEGFEDYRTWCHNNNCQPEVGARHFSRKFLEVFPKCRYARTEHARKLMGVKLSPQNVVV